MWNPLVNINMSFAKPLPIFHPNLNRASVFGPMSFLLKAGALSMT